MVSTLGSINGLQMSTEQLDVQALTGQLPSLVDRLSRESVEIELTDAGRVVARLLPPRSPEGLSAAEFAALLENLPSLGQDAEGFWNDIQEARAAYLPETDPWASS